MIDLKLLAGGAIAGAVALGAVYVQTVRLGAAQAERDAAQAQLAVLGGQIEHQNAQMKALEAESAARLATAAQAARAARARGKALAAQVERLRAARAAPGRAEAAAASGCPAGEAVKDVRRALAG